MGCGSNLSSFSPMTVTLPGSVFGLTSVSSSSIDRVGSADFRCSKRSSASKSRITAIKAVTNHGGVRRIRKNNDEEGEGSKVAKLVENPYSKAEAARPDLRKSLSDFLEEARYFVGEDGPPSWFSPLECAAQAPGSPLLLFIPGYLMYGAFTFQSKIVFLLKVPSFVHKKEEEIF